MATVPQISTTSPPRSKGVPDLLPFANQCTYTPYYCEENMWKLADYIKQEKSSSLQHCHVVFVSNDKRAVPLWRQKAGKTDDKLVIWDYHCILIYHPDERCLVYDLDSELPFPTYFHKYVTETFRTDQVLKLEYHRKFRVIPAATFLQKFSSDRSHMKKADDTWIKPPPVYACISTEESKNNLEDFISMDQKVGYGEILGLTELVRRFFPQIGGNS